MHRYLMSFQRYFAGEQRFEIEAENKNDAIEKAKTSTFYLNYLSDIIPHSLVCIRKLKPSFGEDYERHMEELRK